MICMSVQKIMSVHKRHTYSSLLSVAVRKHSPNPSCRGKCLSHLTLYNQSLSEAMTGTQGRSLEAITEADTIEECCLLACSAGFPIPPSTTSPGVPSPTWCALDPTTSNINQNNATQAYQFDRGNSSLEAPSSQVNSSFVSSWQKIIRATTKGATISTEHGISPKSLTVRGKCQIRTYLQNIQKWVQSVKDGKWSLIKNNISNESTSKWVVMTHPSLRTFHSFLWGSVSFT